MAQYFFQIFLSSENVHFILKCFLIFFVGGLLITSFLYRYLQNKISLSLLLIMGGGLSMYIITWILNWLLFLTPYQSAVFYLTVIALTYIMIFGLYFNEVRLVISKIFAWIKSSYNSYPLIVFILTVAFILFLMGWNYYIYSKQITEHDTLEYAIQGNIFFKDKCIRYEAHHFDKASGFYYVGLHGFSFPLIRTFDNMLNEYFYSNDYLFRSINSVYGMLILMLVFVVGYEFTSMGYGVLISVALILNYGFFETIMKYHIDNYRLLFFLSGIYLMYKNLKEYQRNIWMFSGVILGAQSNIHSLGFMLAFIELLVLLMFGNGDFKTRIQNTLILFFIVMISGGIHYIIDIFWGTGWIFKEVKFY